MSAEPYLRVAWSDPETGIRGWSVIDRLVGRIATGGTRMRAGCTESEVADLARGMSAKAGVFELPVGGAKGGIDCDPHDPRAREVLSRFVAALRPILDDYWVTAEDLGVPQPLLDEIFDEAGLGMSLHAAISRSDDPERTLARVRDAFAVEVGGIALPDVIGGYGVAESAVAAIAELGWPPGDVRAVVQGFGSMGGSTARYLAERGVAVVGLVDRHGVVTNPEGLDVERLLATRTVYGDIDRGALSAADAELPVDAWLDVDAEILVPAAVSYSLRADNVERVRARIVVEAANVPTTAEAEAALTERGIPVIPDFVANGGAAAWAWWTLFGDIAPEADDAFAKLSKQLRGVVPEMVRRHLDGEGSPRQVAHVISRRNLDAFDAAFARGEPPRTIR